VLFSLLLSISATFRLAQLSQLFLTQLIFNIRNYRLFDAATTDLHPGGGPSGTVFSRRCHRLPFRCTLGRPIGSARIIPTTLESAT
jgi:hypothetical protein